MLDLQQKNHRNERSAGTRGLSREWRESGCWGVAACLVILILCSPLWAEGGGGGTATLSGIVTAPDDSRLPGAVITLVRREGGGTRTASGALGVYRISGLGPGSWEMVVVSPGFAEARISGLVLSAGASVSRDLRLGLQKLTESVMVDAPSGQESLEAPRIRESGARDVGEALAAIPGLWSLRKGGIANDIVLRGMQSRDLNVLVDGDRVCGACPNHMDPPPFHVDFAEVDRIEVGKGPFDMRNQGSLGGIVNVVTRDPEPGFRVSPTLALGSFGFVNPAATVSWGGDRFSALGGVSWRSGRADRDGDGRRFTETSPYRPEVVDDRAFSAGTAWTRLRYARSSETHAELSYTRQEAGAILYPYLLMDADYDDTDRLGVKFESRRIRKRVSLVTASAYVTRVDHFMTDGQRLSSLGTARGYSMGTLAHALVWGGKAGMRIGRTTGGMEFYRRYWDTSTELALMGYAAQPSIPGVEVDVLGAYFDYSRIFGDRWLLEAAGRMDVGWTSADILKVRTDLAFAYLGTRQTSNRDALPSGKVRLSWRPGTGLQFALGVGHTARLPEGNERYFGLRRKGTDWVGNPELLPSRNTGGDLGIIWRRPRFSLTASMFANQTDDFITVSEVTRQNAVGGIVNARARTWTNVDATTAGLELSGSLVAVTHVVLSGDVSWVRGSQDPRPDLGLVSTSLPEMPPVLTRAGIRFDDGRFFAAVDGSIASRQGRINTDLGEEETPGYALVSAATGFRRGRVAVTVGVQNLLDETYAPHLSYQRDPFRAGGRVNGPGRTMYLNANARF